MCDDTDNPFLTVQETADLLRVKRRTLDNLRWKNEGPPWRRHGGRIVYHRDEVLAWSEQRRARSGAADENTPRRPAGHARTAPQRQNTAPVSNSHNWPSSGAAYRSRATPPRAPVEHKP
jgi:predicted DNA-binding transcriptional regulator AlpA